MIETDNLILISKLIDGNFPDYNRVVPTANNQILKTSVSDLKTSIDRVSTLSFDKERIVKLKMEETKLTLTSNDGETGKAEESIAAEYNGEELELGFNSKYLLELISVLEGDVAEFHLASIASPAIVHDSADTSSLFVIMPTKG